MEKHNTFDKQQIKTFKKPFSTLTDGVIRLL